MSKKSKAAGDADKIHEVKQTAEQEPAVSSALFCGTDFDICEPVPSTSSKEADILPFSDVSSETEKTSETNNYADLSGTGNTSSENKEIASEPASSATSSSASKQSNSVASDSSYEEEHLQSDTRHERRSFFSKTARKSAPSLEEQILARINDADLMRYLEMEHEKLHLLQSRKESREKRLFTILQLLLSLAAVVTVVFLLRDNPTVLVNILYITGIIVVLWLVKNPLEKDRKKKD